MTEHPTPIVSAGELVAGKYRVERVLGQGGMGMVVGAHHEQLEQRVALKFLLPAAAANQEIVQRFLREARAAVKIHSEHVARVFDVGTHGALPYMVMEYLEGSDLAQTIVERGALPPRDAAGWVLEACHAVAEAHALGIVHRDLKPANLFLAKRPSGKPIVKVLDFGISKAPMTERDRNITNATAIMGSPSYMSPEQLVASASVDARSDIWSLGVVLFEMVTGKLPFNAMSMPELVGVILQGSLPLDDVPPELRGVIERCLQRERERRFSTIAELARALAPIASPRYESLVEHIEATLGGGAPPSSRPPATMPKSAVPQFDNRTLGPTTTAVVKNRQPIWIAVLALIAVAGLAVALLYVTKKKMNAATSVEIPASTAAPIATPNITHDEPVVSPVIAPTAPMPVASAPTTITTPTHVAAHAAPPISSAPAATTAAPSAQNGCKTVSYFDQAGNKHFRLDCH